MSEGVPCKELVKKRQNKKHKKQNKDRGRRKGRRRRAQVEWERRRGWFSNQLYHKIKNIT